MECMSLMDTGACGILNLSFPRVSRESLVPPERKERRVMR